LSSEDPIYTGTLVLLWTPWSVLLSLLVAFGMAGLGLFAWRRSGYRLAVGLLEGLRWFIVVLAALMFNQPEWIETFEPNEKPTIVVTWDDSPSMETVDVISEGVAAESDRQQAETEGRETEGRAAQTELEPDAETHLQSRRESIRPLITDSTWNRLRERNQVVIEPFASPRSSANSQSRRSDIHQPLVQTLEKYPQLLAVVLVTDGDWNAGRPPVEAAVQFREAGIPLFTVPVGSPTRLPDLELLSLEVPTFAVVGKGMRVGWTLESSLPREVLATVILRSSTGDEVSKEIQIPPMSRSSDWLQWKPQEIGDLTLTLKVPPQMGELLTDNNQRSAPISIREEKLRVLIVESAPRWEYRFLRNALSRDPGVDVSCLLFHPGLTKSGGGNQDYIKQFPVGLEQLAVFDVVFLGDVGWEEGQLTKDQCHLLKGLVEHQASGLVFMPGLAGRQLSLLETELEELYPVVLDAAQPSGWGSRTPYPMELTEAGRRSLLTRLADTPEENMEVWHGLPGFQWYAPVVRAKAGSEVLAVHQEVTNQFGRLPLLATRTLGAGKVLFLGTDGAWRWRKGVEDKYHYRFWGQVVRWMAYQRNMAKGETMRLYYAPDQPELEQTVTFRANVMRANGEPLQQGEVSARVVAPSGQSETIRFQSTQSQTSQSPSTETPSTETMSTEEDWGAYFGRYTTGEPGKHHLTLGCKQTGATLETTFFVQGIEGERIGRPARPDVLEELARVSKGQVLAHDQLEQIIELLSNQPSPPLAVRRVQWWSHPLTVGLLITLLAIFWVARKMVGMI
jgi:hypothetical protein